MKTTHKITIKKIFYLHFEKKKTGRRISFPLFAIFSGIIYKLKTGVLWHLLPLEKFFKKKKISYQTVFYHYNSWSKSCFFEKFMLL